MTDLIQQLANTLFSTPPMLLWAQALVLLGLVMIALSLRHSNFLIVHGRNIASGWEALFVMNYSFIFGYGYYFYTLTQQDSFASSDMVVPLMFCSGGFFFLLITSLCVLTVKNLLDLAHLERRHALHDSLTGLPNRIFFNEQACQILQAAHEQNEQLAVLLMDLNRFKEINDTLGHHAGDLLLKSLTPRLQQCTGKQDLVCRLGGDEFAILLRHSNSSVAARVAARISSQIEEPVLIEGNSLSVGASIGIALYPEHGHELPALLRRADIAMYESKRNHHPYWMYAAEQDQEFMRRLVLVNALREALPGHQFKLVFQPRIDVKTQQPSGAEALLRWLHPSMGVIPPDVFIPLAEQAGFMRPITSWVFRSVLEQLQQWQEAGLDINVSFNVSARNLADPNFSDEIGKLLHSYPVHPSSLTLEITESCMITHPETTLIVLDNLAKLGLKLSIDDFGTGFSSMQYLKRLPASEVKVDKNFVMHMLENESDAVIVHATIVLAHNLGYKVIAEGVDSDEILCLLDILECDSAQGYFIGRPMSAKDLLVWLNNRKTSSTPPTLPSRSTQSQRLSLAVSN